jgi:hypothetical protein
MLKRSTAYSIRVEELHPSAIDDDNDDNLPSDQMSRRLKATLAKMRAAEEEARRLHRKLPRWRVGYKGW